jgi:hypothetical protein
MPLARRLGVAALGLLLGVLVLAALQRRLVFFPDRVDPAVAARRAAAVGALPWAHGWRFARPGAPGEPGEGGPPVLLAFHGNAGMALDRAYMADTFGPAGFEVRIVEYPGYGARAGTPSEAAFFEAAEAAFDAVVAEAVPNRPVFVLGESIGTGPACHLARVRGDAMAGLVLVTPYDRLAGPAGDHFPWLPVGLLLRDRFDNAAALASARVPLFVVLAGRDAVVAPVHGRRLYDGYGGPKRLWVDPTADHNDLPWASRQGALAEVAAALVATGR